MTEHNQHKPSLTQLYRRFAGSHAVSVPDADDLLQLARVAHAEEAASPLCADLLRFGRELEPASAQLSNDVTAAFEQAAPLTHHRSATRRATAAGARRWRGVAAIAASLLAVIGAWTSLKHGPVTQPAPVAIGAPQPDDRIFASLDERVAPTPARNDQIFHGNFLPDEIFSSGNHEG
jgi:hypothetical protein